MTVSLKHVVAAHWDKRAAAFDDTPNHGLHDDDQREAWLARVEGWAGPNPIDALDVGCGTGFLALLLARLGHRATGVDGAPRMVALAQEKAAAAGVPATFAEGDAEQLPFAAGSFDLVVERHVLWTLPDPVGALREWKRVLRPGGQVVLVEGDWRSNRNGSGSCDEDYAPIAADLPLYGGRPASELVPLLEAAGFAESRVELLVDEVLWGGVPDHERYALIARAG